MAKPFELPTPQLRNTHTHTQCPVQVTETDPFEQRQRLLITVQSENAAAVLGTMGTGLLGVTCMI